MLVEIPDNKVTAILNGVQSLCNDYISQEDPTPGIGKTSNQFEWFENLNSLLYEQFKHELKLAFENAIDECFSNIQTSLGITSGDVPPDSKLSELQDKFIDECIKVILFQTY